jgi:hypothetical protein
MRNPYEMALHGAATGWDIPAWCHFSAELAAAGWRCGQLDDAPPPEFMADFATWEAVRFEAFVSRLKHPLETANAGAKLVVFSASGGLTDQAPALPVGWLAPLQAFWESLAARLADPGVSDATALATIEASLARMPELLDAMDVDALADQFEAAMGQAAVISMRDRLRLRAYSARVTGAALAVFSASGPERNGVAFAPMLDAVAKLDRKTAVTSKLSSAEWARVALELRERAFFSARVESARFLAVAQDKLRKRLALEREQVGDGKEAFVNRDSFIRDMRRIAVEEGIQTSDASGRGTVRDIRSVKRLGLIYDMQTESAAGFARWKMDNDADVLDEFPAYRLGPSTARVPRPEAEWRARWNAAGASVGWQGASRVDLAALKTSPIWSALSRFGTPWPPFDYGSSRMLEDVDRDEAAALNLVSRTGPVPSFPGGGRDIDGATGRGMGFNATLEASVTDVPPALRDWVVGQFGDRVREKDGRLQWLGGSQDQE